MSEPAPLYTARMRLAEPIRIILPSPTILLNEWQRMHWRERRRHATELAWEVRAAATPPPRPIARCRITVERYSTRLPDWDGLYGGLKPLLDCLIPYSTRHPHGLGFIVDDSPTVIEQLLARPELCRAGQAMTRVLIEKIADAESHGQTE